MIHDIHEQRIKSRANKRHYALDKIIPKIQKRIQATKAFDRVRVDRLPGDHELFMNYVHVTTVTFKWGMALEACGMVLDKALDSDQDLDMWVKEMRAAHDRVKPPPFIKPDND